MHSEKMKDIAYLKFLKLDDKVFVQTNNDRILNSLQSSLLSFSAFLQYDGVETCYLLGWLLEKSTH